MRFSFRTLLILMAISATGESFGQAIDLNKYESSGQTEYYVRIASASVLPKKWDKAWNWSRIESLVRKAATEGGAQVVVTPEGALDGYVINEVNAKTGEEKEMLTKKFIELAEPLDGPFIDKARRLADELEIYFVLGFLELEGTTTYNTAILIDPEGEIIGKYSKTHFAQGYTINPSCYVPGTQYPVFQTPFGKVGMMICYDRQLPEPARILALNGAQILFVPSYGGYTDKDGWNTVLLRTRARENEVPLIFSHPFQSLLINASGNINAMGNSNEVVYYEINTSPDRYEGRFKNRRPETYEALTK
ncbi:MAG: carbon-nitrogen hydrolase family protein [Bacteroidota bacterium]